MTLNEFKNKVALLPYQYDMNYFNREDDDRILREYNINVSINAQIMAMYSLIEDDNFNDDEVTWNMILSSQDDKTEEDSYQRVYSTFINIMVNEGRLINNVS